MNKLLISAAVLSAAGMSAAMAENAVFAAEVETVDQGDLLNEDIVLEESEQSQESEETSASEPVDEGSPESEASGDKAALETSEEAEIVDAAQASTTVTLQGTVASASTDLANVNADYAVVKVTSGTSTVTSDYSSIADKVLKQDDLELVLLHTARTTTAGSAFDEASNYFNHVQNYVGAAVFAVDFTNAVSQGTTWVHDFLDTFYQFSGVRPLIYGTYDTDSYDWSTITAEGYTGLNTFNASSYTGADMTEAKKKTGTAVQMVEMYRCYNPNSGEHFYTSNVYEKNYIVSVGWKYEGVAWLSPLNSTESIPVYRLYNPNAGDHHYTLNTYERDMLVKAGWNYEGIGWYALKSQDVTVYRVYNPNATAGAHHFTTSKGEYDHLVSVGWKGEGTAWFSGSIISNEGSGNYLVTTSYGTVAFNSKGIKIYGVQKVGNTLYYFDKDNKGITKTLTGYVELTAAQNNGTAASVYINADGTLKTGEVQVGNLYKYFSTSTGYMVKSGLVALSDGRVCYYDGSGNRSTETRTIGKNTYYFNASTGDVTKAVINGITYLNQKDSRWTNIIIGGYYFGSTGCVPTSLTMAINYLLGTSYTPVQIGQTLNAAGHFNSNGAGAGGADIVYAGSAYGVTVTAASSVSAIAQCLKSGGVALAAMNPGDFCVPGYTHEILLYGYDNGWTNVYDPLWSVHNASWSLNTIWTQKSTNTLDCSNGGPIFLLTKA